ncbi:MAG: hypothetical protein ACRD1Y_05585 [Terriglobales bacterium]
MKRHWVRLVNSQVFGLLPGNDPDYCGRQQIVVLKAYIDESYRDKGVFALAAIAMPALQWAQFEPRWRRRISAKNRQLKLAGRRQISRFRWA